MSSKLDPTISLAALEMAIERTLLSGWPMMLSAERRKLVTGLSLAVWKAIKAKERTTYGRSGGQPE